MRIYIVVFINRLQTFNRSLVYYPLVGVLYWFCINSFPTFFIYSTQLFLQVALVLMMMLVLVVVISCCNALVITSVVIWATVGWRVLRYETVGVTYWNWTSKWKLLLSEQRLVHRFTFKKISISVKSYLAVDFNRVALLNLNPSFVLQTST